MRWPFRRGPRPVLDPEPAEWHLEGFEWLLRECGGGETYWRSRLVLPTAEFFPASPATGHALALEMFERTRTLCGLDEWPIELVVDENPLADLYHDPGHTEWDVDPGRPAAGLYLGQENGRVTIAYSPPLLRHPLHLIATFAHELAHALIHGVEAALPCEPEEEEFLTDLAVAYLGFGVIGANASYTPESVLTGLGYLPERDLTFDTALFVALGNGVAADARAHLKPRLRPVFDAALAQLEGEPALARMRALVGERPDT